MLSPFLIIPFLINFISGSHGNFLANAAFDGVISIFHSSLDPIQLNDTTYPIRQKLFLTSLNFGSITLKNTTITGLSNLTRIGDIDVDLDVTDGHKGSMSLACHDVLISTIMHPSLGGILQFGYPLPVEILIEYMQIDFTLTSDAWGGNVKIRKLKISKLEAVEVDIDYRMMPRPMGRVANRILNESLVRVLNGVLRRMLEKTIKRKLNESLKDYSLSDSLFGR